MDWVQSIFRNLPVRAIYSPLHQRSGSELSDNDIQRSLSSDSLGEEDIDSRSDHSPLQRSLSNYLGFQKYITSHSL